MSKSLSLNSCIQPNHQIQIQRKIITTKNYPLDRRTLIGLTGFFPSSILLKQDVAGAQEIETSICDKFSNQNPQIPFIPPFSSPEPIYYPNWLFGEWNVKAVQQDNQKEFSFRLKFYSTFPDTLENQLKFNLGLAIPRAAIIADRAFNLKQICNTYLGRLAVDDIEYFPRVRNIRNQITASYQLPADAQQDRIPTQIQIIKTEQDSQENNVEFCSSELFRPALEGSTNENICDFENVYKFTKQGKNQIKGKQRIILYKQTQGIQQFGSSGEAAAIYDFDLNMQIVTPEEQGLGTGDFRCVENPKAIVQCA